VSTAERAEAHTQAGTGRLTVSAAIVHDWFQGYHGAERVVEAMRTGLFATGGEPDIFTFHAARELLPPELAAAIVKESRLAGLPGLRQRGHDPGRWRLLVPAMPRYFSHLDLRAYDLVISSSHAFAVHARPREDAAHVCYCHTPIRYAWIPETDARARAIRGWLRRTDLAASRRPDAYVANSAAVQQRIQRFYGRDSTIVHPPVDVDDFDPHGEKDPGLFLWVHRLVSYKNPETVVEAFRGLPYRLTMVGVGPLEETLRANLPENVELDGWLPREELARRYERASGFVHVGEEDFGITMVEALAAGTPVIALDRGGARDIVRAGEDGLLVPDARPETIRRAVRELAGRDWDRDALAARAAEFSRDRFLERMLAVVEGVR
jgi:glycosyltransferase involved in cell wall biosynthesis